MFHSPLILEQNNEELDKRKAKMDATAAELAKHGASVGAERRSMGTYIATFSFEDGARTTIRLKLTDETGADLVITNITTLPETEEGKGYGSQAVTSVLAWASEQHFSDIRAVQVSGKKAETFWEKNGFVRQAEPNPCNDFLYRGAQ